MSKRAQYAIAVHLCKTSKPCAHHMELAEDLVEMVVEAQKFDREDESLKALDRVVSNVSQKEIR